MNILLFYSIKKHKLKLYIEKHEFEHDDFQKNEDAQKLKESIHLFKQNEENLDDKIDLVVCLGGDGTLLHVNTLFQVLYYFFFH